jgi:hypothetical protein
MMSATSGSGSLTRIPKKEKYCPVGRCVVLKFVATAMFWYHSP